MLIDKSKQFSNFFEQKNQPRKIDFLVLHHVEATCAEDAIRQFIEHQVSSHFLIDESGKIFQLVNENNIAYHAGVSFWRGVDGLNQNSIGIEFVNSKPFAKKFETLQMLAGIELCQNLIKKYDIAARNIVGHSDIAYNKETGFLDRKQDPSYLFDWKFLSEHGIGFFPQILAAEKKLFELGAKNSAIKTIKENLKKVGYHVLRINDEFDFEMQLIVRVFNRRFIGKNEDSWLLNSQEILEEIVDKYLL